MMKPRTAEVILGWGPSSHTFLLVLLGSLMLAGIPRRGRRVQGALELWHESRACFWDASGGKTDQNCQCLCSAVLEVWENELWVLSFGIVAAALATC